MSMELLRDFGAAALIAIVLSLFVGSVLMAYAVIKIRKLNIPPEAGFVGTLYLTPLIIVLAIDLLDLGLDFLAAPISWAILDRLGLKALRNVSAVEALIPGTQLIPTMTLCWFAVRLLKLPVDFGQDFPSDHLYNIRSIGLPAKKVSQL